VTAASKGSAINPSQIICCVGQQNVEGKRIPNGFTDRYKLHYITTYAYTIIELLPISKSLIPVTRPKALSRVVICTDLIHWNSISTAWQEEKVTLHVDRTKGAGLIDTAVKTSEIGYLQRR
jgi:DNA-directed RNA polymerase II subunit RPB1